MKERPILFNGEMVRAILDGRKTQTRRVLNPQPVDCGIIYTPKNGIQGRLMRWGKKPSLTFGSNNRDLQRVAQQCPYGKPGDRLWVRETFSIYGEANQIEYRATPICGGNPDGGWKPCIFMPRDLSRITLEITDIRVERVQEITFQECLKEGVPEATSMPYMPYQKSTVNDFRELWNSINGPRGYGWDVNPWVWVVEFKRVAPFPVSCSPSPVPGGAS